jgi:prepilin-type N-terminal cleavage/methylation domain-containing protein
MKNQNRGVSLIELLIVISIIGILGTVALPYYQGYMLRTRLIEVENTMAVIKNAVSSYRIEKETSWPDCPTIIEIRNSLGVGLGAISRISSLSVDPTTGAITARVLNVHPMVDGETITLTPALAPDNSFSWNWGWSAGFPNHLRTKH